MAKGLRGLLQRQGVHAADLAEALEVHELTVYSWLRGETRPREWRVDEIAEALEVQPDTVRKALDETPRRTRSRD